MYYFYHPEISYGDFFLNEEESKHCIRVLRKNTGDTIIVLDGKGGIYTCQIILPNDKKTELKILEKQIVKAPDHFIHLAIAPTKSIERTEWFVEKSIEIGVQCISFLTCQNSERRKLNMVRLQKKAINAMKQSQVPFLPIINNIQPFEAFIENTDSLSAKYICHAGMGQGNYLLYAARNQSNSLALIGPEGDFTPDELHMAKEKGFEPVSLGVSRLRTETAGLVACTLFNALNAKDR
jgi:16S rRNA (uracil1498-N3)-methyltransferase